MVDRCGTNQPFSAARFALFTIDFLVMLVGGVGLFIWLGGRPFGVQLASIVPYTCAILLYTFSANRGMPRYAFGCPFVRRQLPRLALWHIGFLATLLLLQTEVIHLQSHLPTSWSYRDMPPVTTTIGAICLVLGVAQIMSNRSLLNRAHLENDLANSSQAKSFHEKAG